VEKRRRRRMGMAAMASLVERDGRRKGEARKLALEISG